MTGFLLAGVGNVDLRRKTNYLVVNESAATTSMCHPSATLQLVKIPHRLRGRLNFAALLLTPLQCVDCSTMQAPPWSPYEGAACRVSLRPTCAQRRR